MKQSPAKRRRSPSSNEGRGLTPARRRLFTLITLSVPIFFLAGLELFLQAVNYGPNLSLFTTEQIGGKIYHVMNPDVKGRYFTHIDFTPNTSPDYFLAPEPAGTFRIFCLGGSTTVGFPYGFIGSFSTFLRDRLRRVFPATSIEVINLGMTATNSYTTTDIAHELVNYEPDLIIVYDGHNEFYGAFGIASNESLGSSRFLTRIYLKLIHFRTFLFLRSIAFHIREFISSSASRAQTGTMMEQVARGQYVPFHSTIYQRGLENFKSNLAELKSICQSHNIPLIVSSQVSNLRDLPPFVSTFQDGIPPQRRSESEQLFSQGESGFGQGDFTSALQDFRTCLQTDSSRADVHYEIARCLDTLGFKEQAFREYVAARDYDQLRFRTSTDFNNAIKGVASSGGVSFADIEKMFAEHSPHSLIGRNLILEHLHPNLRGNFLIAKEYANIMREQGLIATPDKWAIADTVGDEELWDLRSITDLDLLSARMRIAILTSGWPFQPGEPHHPDINPQDTLQRIVDQLVKGRATWEQVHVAAAEYYDDRGDLEKAAREYRALINQLPYNVSAYFRLAQLYARQKQWSNATNVVAQTLGIEKSAFGYQMLGQIALEFGQLQNAVAFLDSAFTTSSTMDERANAGYLLAVAYIRSGKPDLALAPLQHIVSIKPQFREARALLNQLTSKN